MRPPPPQFALAELIGLVALCGMSFALLRTPAAPLGAGVLVVVPGFVLGCSRGGKGITGGILSGCLIPMGMATFRFGVEYIHGVASIREALDLLPVLLALLVACLIWSGLLSTFLYFVDRRWLGASRRDRQAARFLGEGIRFLPDHDGADRLPARFIGLGIRFLPNDDEPGSFAETRSERAASTPASEGGMDG